MTTCPAADRWERFKTGAWRAWILPHAWIQASRTTDEFPSHSEKTSSCSSEWRLYMARRWMWLMRRVWGECDTYVACVPVVVAASYSPLVSSGKPSLRSYSNAGSFPDQMLHPYYSSAKYFAGVSKHRKWWLWNETGNWTPAGVHWMSGLTCGVCEVFWQWYSGH